MDNGELDRSRAINGDEDNGDPEYRDSITFSSLEDADILLVSSDHIAFTALRGILKEASPFFRNLFADGNADISQMPLNGSDASASIPSVQMEENAEILHILLRYIYPLHKPTPSLQQVYILLRIADKYEMEWLRDILRTSLVSESFLASQPAQVFLIARAYGLKDEAAIATRRSLEVDVMSVKLHEMNFGEDSCRNLLFLMQFHQHRARTAISLLTYYVPHPRKGIEGALCSECAPSTPRWWFKFLATVQEQLARFPISKNLFSMEKVTEAIESSRCMGCWLMLPRWADHFSYLTRKIDALPSTFEEDTS